MVCGNNRNSNNDNQHVMRADTVTLAIDSADSDRHKGNHQTGICKNKGTEANAADSILQRT